MGILQSSVKVEEISISGPLLSSLRWTLYHCDLEGELKMKTLAVVIIEGSRGILRMMKKAALETDRQPGLNGEME